MLLTEEKPNFKVCDNIPTGKTKQILNMLYSVEENRYKDLKYLENEIVRCADVLKFYERYKTSTRCAKVIEYSSYWEAMNECNGGLVLPADIYEKGLRVADSLRSCKYFNELKDDCIFQKPFFFEINGVECKALPDILYINENTKTIYVIDIKTTSEPLYNFARAIDKYRYDIQAAFYVDAVAREFPDYIVTFQFLVQNTEDIFKPLLLTCDNGLFDRGRVGCGGKKGYYNLIDDYLWYKENGFENHRSLEDIHCVTADDGGYIRLF